MQTTESMAGLRRPASATHSWSEPQQVVLKPLMARAAKVSCVVGTCLTLINQADLLFGREPAPALFWKIPLTYCVPFCVSLYSALAAMKSR